MKESVVETVINMCNILLRCLAFWCVVYFVFFLFFSFFFFIVFFILPGYYAFIESSQPRHRGDKAWLLSESLSLTGHSVHCFSFWYHMYGVSVGTLNVYKSTNGSLPGSIQWKLSGNQGNTWKQAHLPVSSTVAFNVSVGCGDDTYNGADGWDHENCCFVKGIPDEDTGWHENIETGQIALLQVPIMCFYQYICATNVCLFFFFFLFFLFL